MLFLRQSTASQEILLGPFVDSTDGVTPENALTISNTDIKIWKEGATTLADKNSGGATYITSSNGLYSAVLDATDSDTVGKMEIHVYESGALPIKREFHVLEEAVYDALFAASAAGYQVPIWASAGSTVNLSATTIKTATDVETDTADIQTRLPAALVSGRIDASVGAMATDVLTSTALAASAVTEIQSGLATPTNITAATGITVSAIGAGVITAASIATGAIDADALATDAVAEIADGVWDEALSGHLTAGSTGEALNAAGAAGDPWTTALPGAYGAGSAGKIIGDNINATISSRASQTSLDTVDDFLDTEIAAIKAQTDLIPAAPASTTNITSASGITVSALGAGVITAASIATDAIDADAIAASAVTEIQSGLATPTNITSATGVTVSSIGANVVTASALAADAVTEIVTAILTTAMTESYNTDGAAPTLTQALMLVLQILSESSVSGTTLTVKKLDGTTTAATFTLSDATTPTSIFRAS